MIFRNYKVLLWLIIPNFFMTGFSFKKSERLNKKRIISQIFLRGIAVYSYPVKLVYLSIPFTEGLPNLQLAVSVPKRRFSKAIDRNLLKRRIKESFRLNKHAKIPELVQKKKSFALVLIYNSNKIESYQHIEKSVKKLLARLS